MAFQDIEQASAQFNERYGVKFDLSDFDTKLRAIDDSKGLGSKKRNDLYKTAFTALYEAAYGNYLSGKLETFDFADMLKDFENNVMKPYREFCASEPTPISTPKEYGSWGSSNRLFMMDVHKYLQGVPTSARYYAGLRYEKGKTRIRDMREYAASINNKEKPTNGEIATLQVYADALQNTNDSRSVFWRIIHPIRNAAEKREAKNFQAQVNRMISESVGGDAQAVENKANEIDSLIKADHVKFSAMYDHVKELAGVNKILARHRAEKANVRIDDVDSNTVSNVPVSQPVTHTKEIEHSAPDLNAK